MGMRTVEGLSEVARSGEPRTRIALELESKQAFRTAIEISRKQRAKSWELRATTSLARLLDRQGKGDEARAILAEIYNWFTEGFDTADLPMTLATFPLPRRYACIRQCPESFNSLQDIAQRPDRLGQGTSRAEYLD
jgi:hypothetical protein